MIDIIDSNSTTVDAFTTTSWITNNNQSDLVGCVHHFDDTRKNVTSLFGTAIATTGIVLNIFILMIFRRMSRLSLRVRTTLFLQLLALFDIGVLACYLILYPWKVLSEHLLFPAGYMIWVKCVKYVYPVSRFCQMATTWVTLVVTICNYVTLSTSKGPIHFSRHRSRHYIFAVCTFCLACHITRYWEVKEESNPDCNVTEFGYYTIVQSSLLKSETYRTWYSLYFTNVVNVFLPFTALIICAALNAVHYKGTAPTARTAPSPRIQLMPNGLPSKHRRASSNPRDPRHRDATMVTIVLVITYLCFNVLTVLISLLEFFAPAFIGQNRTFYVISVEVINISAVTNSSTRVVNYLIFNHQFRCQAAKLFTPTNKYTMVPRLTPVQWRKEPHTNGLMSTELNSDGNFELSNLRSPT